MPYLYTIHPVKTVINQVVSRPRPLAITMAEPTCQDISLATCGEGGIVRRMDLCTGTEQWDFGAGWMDSSRKAIDSAMPPN